MPSQFWKNIIHKDNVGLNAPIVHITIDFYTWWHPKSRADIANVDLSQVLNIYHNAGFLDRFSRLVTSIRSDASDAFFALQDFCLFSEKMVKFISENEAD